ncbi:MAG: hypothetical protein F6K04_17480 [Leptolyngbya sp. SIO4C5]|uniref:hypothetical protein n=1 Tax=Sphaerothrix gracilis TaxID=3151835 RepID=UPI0013C217B8|nr:hypothetical protein [Leptolyngbya sp. SIO4C5]
MTNQGFQSDQLATEQNSQLGHGKLLFGAIALSATMFSLGFGVTRQLLAHKATEISSLIPQNHLAQQLEPARWEKTAYRLALQESHPSAAKAEMMSQIEGGQWSDRFTAEFSDLSI